MDVFEVLQPGLYTTIQDRGRFGYLQFGIPPCGVVDAFAYRVSNLLVGNDGDEGVLEITVAGPVLQALEDAVLALTGGDLSPCVNDAPLPMWQSVPVRQGDRIRFKGLKSGCRAYLSVAGGIDVAPIMKSRSTYVAGKIGGIEGRPLRKGDRVPKGETKERRRGKIPQAFIPSYSNNPSIRAIPGPQDEYFSEGIEILFRSEFQVSSKADRMGYRLEGPVITHRDGVEKSIISEPSVPGGIQIPPDGQPIILLIEQTVGGYTKIATVISTDLSKVAQAKPGDRIRFERIDLEKARQAYRDQERVLERIRNEWEE